MAVATARGHGLRRPTRLARLGRSGRLEAYRRGELKRAELWSWAQEPPLLNGKYEWIVRDLE